MTFYCTWCGAELDADDIKAGDHPDENWVGKCEDDGIVYVTTDPEEANA